MSSKFSEQPIRNRPVEAVDAVYTPTGLPEYDGNPLITALPPIMSQSVAYKAMAKVPDYFETDCALPPEVRLHCLQRIKDYFAPVSRHFHLEQTISHMIRQGYRDRSPNSAEHKRRLERGYQRVMRGLDPGDDDKFDTNNGAWSSALIGPSGSGKTRAIARILSSYRCQVITHKSPDYAVQITWLHVECPHNGTDRQLAINFFTAVDKVLGTNHAQTYGGLKSANQMIPHIWQLAELYHIGMIVFDEVQNLNLREHNQRVMKFLTGLNNQVNVPVIVIGTMQAMKMLQADFRLPRRLLGLPLWDRFNRDKPNEFEEWNFIIEGMWRYQWTLACALLIDELRDTLYELSQGIVGVAAKLFVASQARAIMTGDELINSELIRQVADDSHWLAKPMLDALRRGDPDALQKYPDIMPPDDEMLILMESWNKKRGSPASTVPLVSAPAEPNDLFQSVVQMLGQIGYGMDVAKVALDMVLSENPDLPSLRIVQKVIERLAGPDGKQGVRKRSGGARRKDASAKADAKATETSATGDLPEHDLCQLLAEAELDGTTAYDAIKVNSLIKSPFEEFGL